MTITATASGAWMSLSADPSVRAQRPRHPQTLFDQQLQTKPSAQPSGPGATPSGSFLSADMLRAIAAGGVSPEG